jgi:hypothetical protein
MVNYQNGKVYRIDGDGLTYIGSTTKKYLSTRLAGHKSDYKRFLNGESHYLSSFEILKTDNYRIELIEKFPCDSKDELTAREGHFIRTMECVNKQIAGRTIKEWGQDNPEYNKQYRENNKEAISAQNKQYREKNRETLSAKQRQFYQDNKKELVQKHVCECGGKYTYKHKSRHLKTKKHLNYLKRQLKE